MVYIWASMVKDEVQEPSEVFYPPNQGVTWSLVCHAKDLLLLLDSTISETMGQDALMGER